MKYTGVFLASDAQGVSISIGYMVDSYIDFGTMGMFFPIFLLGLLWGTIYKVFFTKSRYKIVGLGFAIIVLIPVQQLEVASVKLLGTVVMSFLVMVTMMHFLEKPFFNILNPKIEINEKIKGRRRSGRK